MAPKYVETKDGVRLINLDKYRVGLPAGDGWKVRVNRRREWVEYWRSSDSTMIHIKMNWIADKAAFDWTEEDVAEDYLGKEAHLSGIFGPAALGYESINARRDTLELDGRRFYFATYRKAMPGNGKQEAQAAIRVYLSFPESFRRTHIFYILAIQTPVEGDEHMASLMPIIPVLRTFQPK